MAYRANDLVTDKDLLAYEGGILSAFNKVEWADKRGKALSDWLWPLLKQNGFPVEKFRTRYEADKAYALISSAFADQTGEAKSTTVDDINLATTFATVNTDALYVGSTHMFRGLSIRLSDAVSAVASTMTVSLWTDAWEAVAITDGTARTTGKTFSGGGAVTWRVPTDWVLRSLNGSDPLYWARIQVSATPTGATAGQIGVIRDSLLTGPATCRTLALIMREAKTQQDGPWTEKAQWYEEEAERAFARAMPSLGGEFDTGEASDQISEAESQQTSDEVTGGGWTFERS